MASAPGCSATSRPRRAARGYRSLLCLTQPDNDAVLATIRRVGLPHTVTHADGLMRIVMQLTSAEAALPLPA